MCVTNKLCETYNICIVIFFVWTWNITLLTNPPNKCNHIPVTPRTNIFLYLISVSSHFSKLFYFSFIAVITIPKITCVFIFALLIFTFTYFSSLYYLFFRWQFLIIFLCSDKVSFILNMSPLRILYLDKEDTPLCKIHHLSSVLYHHMQRKSVISWLGLCFFKNIFYLDLYYFTLDLCGKIFTFCFISVMCTFDHTFAFFSHLPKGYIHVLFSLI